MAKVCKSCGKYYKGDFCENCGYGNKDLKVKAIEKYKKFNKPERFMNDEEKKEYYDRQRQLRVEKKDRIKGKSNKNLLIFVAIIALAVIISGLVSSGVIYKSEKSDVINNYFDAINERDFDKYIKCFPSEMKEDYKNDRKKLNYSKSEYMDEFAKAFEEDFGKGFNITIKLGKEKQLEEYSMDGYKEAYGTVPNISEAYIVSVTVNISGPEKTEEAHMECYVGKVKGRWKLFNIEQVAGTITEESLSSES